MKELQVGDEVYYFSNNYEHINYIFAKVERLTKTTAVLDNGIILYNRHCYAGFRVKVQDYKYYKLVTEEIKKEYLIFKHNSKINNWFNKQKFTQEEREQIYNLFNNELNTK